MSAETAEQKLETEIKTIKTQILDAIKAKADASVVADMQRQLDALDTKLAQRHTFGAFGEKTLETLLKENDGIQRLLHDRKGSAIVEVPQHLIERKTNIDSAAVGASTSGVLTIDRTPGIVPEARQRLFLRDVLTARPTTMQIVDFVKVNSALSRASVQTESSAKMENAVTFNTSSAKVQTIATWIPASRQVLDDFAELLGFLQTGLAYEVNLAEEVQMLTGSNTGNDLNGLVTQGTAYNTALNGTSWQRIDILAHAIQQIQIAKEIKPSFVVVHPTDAWALRLTKDTQGRYISNQMDVFWGLQPIETVNIGSGQFLVGSGNPAAVEIRDRMEMAVEISTQHSTFFTSNQVAVRAEKRLALACYRPGSFVVGNWNSSP